MNGSIQHPSAAPRVPRREVTRARICAAAKDVFVARGFNGATIDDIAAAAGTRRSTLYNHFSDKNQILQAIAEDYLSGLRAIIRDLPAPQPSRRQIDGWFDQFADFVVRERAPTILLVHTTAAIDAPPAALSFGAEVMRIYAAHLPAFAKALEPGHEIELVRARTVLRELGWACCYHVENPGSEIGPLMFEVAADLFERFVNGWF